MCYTGTLGTHQSLFFESGTEVEYPVKIVYQLRVRQWLEETKAFRNEFVNRGRHSVSHNVVFSDHDDNITISARFTRRFFRLLPCCIWYRDRLYWLVLFFSEIHPTLCRNSKQQGWDMVEFFNRRLLSIQIAHWIAQSLTHLNNQCTRFSLFAFDCFQKITTLAGHVNPLLVQEQIEEFLACSRWRYGEYDYMLLECSLLHV